MSIKKVCATILAIIFVPKIVSPQIKIMGVSLRMSKTLCSSYEESLGADNAATYGHSHLSNLYTEAGNCVWGLNRDSWDNAKEKKGIWQFACTEKGSRISSGRAHERGGSGDYRDPCAKVQKPPSTPGPMPVPDLSDGCTYGKYTNSIHCRNYYVCEKTSQGSTYWEERTCGTCHYWDPTKQKCSDFGHLPLASQQLYCHWGCVEKIPPSSPGPHWSDGPRECPYIGVGCEGDNLRNVTEYCRNFRKCIVPTDIWVNAWQEFVCPQNKYWYQKSKCDGICETWDKLPGSLQHYYWDHQPSITPPDPSKTTLAPTTTTKPPTPPPPVPPPTPPPTPPPPVPPPTPPPPPPPTPPPGPTPPRPTYSPNCECKLRGYCKWFEICIDEVWTRRNFCSNELYWLPNPITGGTCSHFESLPQDLQEKYKEDPDCYNCDWYQEEKDVCSPRYTFRDSKGNKHAMSCPKGKSQLYWQIKMKTCDECMYATDYRGAPCNCN